MTRRSKRSSNSSDRKSSSGLDGIADSEFNRRTFLKGTIAATAVVGVGGLALKGSSLAATTTSQTPTSSDPFAAQTITLIVNGTDYQVSVEPRDMLVNVLREDLGLIGTKRPCNRMECGGCAVLIDGTLQYSCTYPAIRLGNGQQILTTEAGVGAKSPDPVISALQQAWVTEDAGQCAYCGPGQIMSAAALLKSNTNPTVPEIKMALSGNLCRCGAYLAIINAVQAATTTLQGSGA
jgi:aerobic-type carbon monoxide dehydrogenase small subunit (CoxS/CutS family)